uniref:Putative serine/threonine-protein kinase n=1 Tax=Anopheles triannulatus TaxID=58253 RepID=A0A2M4A8G9_9DIPT
MQREEINAALRQMAEDKIRFLENQTSKLCPTSLSRFQKLMDIFSSNLRIKSENIKKAINELTKLEAEVSVKIELQLSEKQVKSSDNGVVRQNVMQPQLANPSESNFGMRFGHSQVSATPVINYDAPVINYQSNLTKPYSKPNIIESTLNHEIIQMSYQSQPIEPSFINEERLSLKYPRKKKNPDVGSTGSSSVFKCPAIPEIRGDDKLFFRRAEVFPKPPTAQTYAEHRMLKANEMSLNNRQTGAGLHEKFHSPTQNNLRNSHLGFETSTHTNAANTETRQSSYSPNLLLGVYSKSTQSIPIQDHGATVRNNSPHALSKPVQLVSTESRNGSETATKSTCVTEDTLPSSSDNHVGLSQNEISKTSPTKTRQNGFNREVHNLIVGQIKFNELLNRKEEIEKLRNTSNRTESINDREKNENWRKDLLNKYGMQKETRVLLTRLEDDNSIAFRTRSKSTENSEFPCGESSNTIQQNKKSPHTNGKITMRRKTIDCRAALKNPSQTKQNREQVKNKNINNRRKSHCANSMTVSPDKIVQNSFYLSDSEGNGSQDFTNEEPPKKKRIMNNRKLNSVRDIAKKTTNTKSKNKAAAFSSTRDNSGSKTSATRQENSVIDKQVDIPNDNPDIHCQSNFMSSCSLCSYRGGEIIDHYLSKHKQNEVFVSRISPRQSDIVRKLPIPLHDSEKNVSKNGLDPFTRFCCFCEKNLVLTYKEWIEHIAQHTGEYEFNREAKTVKKPFVEIKFQNNNILAYICDRCNYVQTRLSAMENHLMQQHISLEDGTSAKSTECIRFAVCRLNVESTSIENKTNLKLKPEPIFGCEVVNNPIDKDEESAISDAMDHEILQELERMHGCEPLIDCIVKEEIDLNADPEPIHQCGKKGTTHANVTEANEITKERYATELTGSIDDPMEYDSDDSLNTIAMDDPDYKHAMGGIKEEEFAEEFRKSDRDNELQHDENIDQNQDYYVVPSLNEPLSENNGNGTEIQVAARGTDEEIHLCNGSNEIRNESDTDSPAKKTCIVGSTNGGSFESAKIQEDQPSTTTMDGNADAIAEQTVLNSDPFEIVRNEEHLQYLCLYSNCKSVFSNIISLEKHVQTKHSVLRWNGYCHTCKAYIENQTGLTKQFAIHHLKHILSKHSDPKLNIHVRQPLKIRLRRLSGDKLSVINN